MTVFALDANILSYILRKDENVLARLRAEQDAGHECVIPPLAYYEVKRGLLAVGADVRLRLFETLCLDFPVGEMNRAAWDQAAHLYAAQRKKGLPVDEADIFIAAFCLVGGYTLATNNVRHFENFAGLSFVNWK